MKSTNVATYRAKPPARCGWCLKPAWSNSDTCRECRGIEANARQTPTPTHALTGGHWVPRGGILVWDGPRDIDPPYFPERPAAQCGTDSGYHRHLKRTKTPPCEPCKAAHSAANGRAA